MCLGQVIKTNINHGWDGLNSPLSLIDMSPPSQLPPQPPAPPPRHHHHLLIKMASLPDVIFTAFSLFVLFSSSSKPTSVFFLPHNKISFPLNPQRFLKFPTISFPLRKPTNRRNTGNRPFPTPQSLSDWLKPRLPSNSFALWGVKPGTKNVHNLWLEISEGETSLADSTPPVRTVEVVIVRIIRNDGKVLVESHQELSNGDVRTRCRPLSEKMKPAESVEAAVFRAVKEELGSIIKNGNVQNFGHYGYDIDDIVKIVTNSYVKRVEERASASYPGLPACYMLHTVDAEVEWLPEGEFCTEEVEEYGDFDRRNIADSAVHCKKHYWKWVDSNSV